ncbi:twin-arginine translocase subunit TatC [Micavibrio aeruginosavorus]|uniref:Sec-independent protein translocase protein TatC n=1 Tax=Micavibrio aeruginosavorus EPB TaxID=349215 RepID=M4VH51_9BACT|nr:twin-arginine translocase subunit TatC [Micavibrio aeruginosavorus]AGH97381.1 Twin-arginine translocation protein TatC [Micavibrio aeruginosavorus EPB]
MTQTQTPAPESEQMEPDHNPKPLVEHLVELRNRLMWCFLAVIAGTGFCYFFVQDIYGFLVRPLADAMGDGDTQRLIYTNLTEAFFTYIKISFFGGLFLMFPVLAVQIWGFIAPGLYGRERRAFLPYLVATPVLFITGAALVYYFIMPLAWRFFLGFQSTGAETALPIQLEARVSEYLDLVMVLMFAFGLCFQLPVLLSLMARAGLITAETLASRRKYAIVVIFVAAAVLTPPDIISQVGLAIPLIGLYEMSIVLVRRICKERAARHGA